MCSLPKIMTGERYRTCKVQQQVQGIEAECRFCIRNEEMISQVKSPYMDT